MFGVHFDCFRFFKNRPGPARCGMCIDPPEANKRNKKCFKNRDFVFLFPKLYFIVVVFLQQEMKYKVTVMLFLLISVFFGLELNRSNSPFSFENDKSLPQMKIKPKISKHRQVKSEDVKTSAGTSAGDKHCRRKEHVVYIKTHKTGSTTAAGVFWRFVCLMWL